jgi:predicted nucleotidyltransferase
MGTGRVEADLVRLNEEFKLSYLDDPIARKLDGAEKTTLEDADLVFHQREYNRLRRELEDAHQTSRLPENHSCKSALNDLLLRLRMDGVR